jgi:imidazolonepropionase-like amidohydrolase
MRTGGGRRGALGTTLLLSLGAAAAIGFRPGAGEAQERPVAFVDVAVIPMIDAGVVEHQTVVVVGGRITSVGPASAVEPPAGARLIAGQGRFLIPGLVDAHVHLMEEADLGQFLFHGVTTVRNLMGSEETLRLKRGVAVGSLVGPRIITSGPLFAGPDTPWRRKVVPVDPVEARAAVRRQRDAGYDLIKIYDGLPADVYEAVVDEAARVGMRATGHIPEEVRLARVLEAGQDLEHTDKLVYDVWNHAFDETRIDSVAARVREAGVFATPTIASMQQLARIASGGFDSLLARPETNRVGAATLSSWCEVSSSLAGHRVRGPGVRYDLWTDFQMLVIAGLRRAGVPLLAGTDYPNAVLSAGGGLLVELRALEEIGLTRFEVLSAATTTAGRAIGDPTSGFIAPGARADLILLGDNPLDDLEALSANEGVMVAGAWYTPEDLARLAPGREAPPMCGP